MYQPAGGETSAASSSQTESAAVEPVVFALVASGGLLRYVEGPGDWVIDDSDPEEPFKVQKKLLRQINFAVAPFDKSANSTLLANKLAAGF